MAVASRAILAACVLLLPTLSPQAATLRWTGLGASPLWSDAANWDAVQVPGNGDTLWFGGGVTRADSVLDLTRTFAALTFAADAPAFALHVQGSGAVLAFDGAGIRNGTGGGGPFRQDFYADAGSVGGSLVFAGHAGLNLGDATSLRPVNLTASGATTATGMGGHIVFQNDAATSADTYDQLRAEGAGAAGGTGGDISLRDHAIATRTASITVTGGTVLGAFGARASFADLARADAIVNVMAGEGGGLGARVDFAGRATASVYASFSNRGAVSATVGAQGLAMFRDDATLAGSVTNEAGLGAGFAGGQLEFRDRASHDTTGLDPALGLVLIRNGGAAVAGARGGSTVFRDDAAVLGAGLFILNGVQAEGAQAGSAGGTTEFRDRARAGQASLLNEGAAAAGAGSGSTSFSGQASAEGASIVNAPGGTAGTLGGTTRFSGNALASSAVIVNQARTAPGGGAGGSTVFADDASAQRATISNEGGLFTSDNASTSFRDRASAGQALITNLGGAAASAFGGATNFDGRASAASAVLVMAGGGVDRALGGAAVFSADASAGAAMLDVRGASVFGAGGGRAFFYDRSGAGGAQIAIAGSSIDHVLGQEAGSVTFASVSSAGDASITAGGNSFAGGGVGMLRFTQGATAARAKITLSAGQTRGGALSFEGTGVAAEASAGDAQITNQGSSSGAPRGLAIGGQTTFAAFSTAGSATLTNQAGFGAGLTNFFAASNAGDARLVNLGGVAGEDGGTTQFNNTASAQRAVIVNRAGALGAAGFDAAGSTRFVDQASAGQARITAEGGASAGTVGGLITFSGNANPAGATLIAEGGTNGGTGGRIRFAGLTNASQARIVLNAGSSPGAAGELDISALSVGAVAVGALEGGGRVNLGSKNLTVWAPTASVFSGLLRDGGVAGGAGGSLSVTGGAMLTLAGGNTYSGVTRIGDGLNAGSGKLVAANTQGSATGTGEVVVQRGGTLAGSGFITGPVTLMDGGVIAPGDPVTLTLGGDLTWNGGGLIRLALGADSAGSDHLVMHSLVRGTAGTFVFDLVDFGMTAGVTYELLTFDSAIGFAASDFSFRGLAGTMALQDGRLAFTTSAVPEPGSAGLWLTGLLALGGFAARRRGGCLTSALWPASAG